MCMQEDGEAKFCKEDACWSSSESVHLDEVEVPQSPQDECYFYQECWNMQHCLLHPDNVMEGIVLGDSKGGHQKLPDELGLTNEGFVLHLTLGTYVEMSQ